ncbi:hypothetical protein ACLH0T_21095, partial [Aeromonas media]
MSYLILGSGGVGGGLAPELARRGGEGVLAGRGVCADRGMVWTRRGVCLVGGCLYSLSGFVEAVFGVGWG